MLEECEWYVWNEETRECFCGHVKKEGKVCSQETCPVECCPLGTAEVELVV